jgi:signal transduction histidine kinase
MRLTRFFPRRFASSPVMLFAAVVGIPALVITALGLWVIRLDWQLSDRQQAERVDRAAQRAAQSLDEELREWDRAADSLSTKPACTADALPQHVRALARPPAAAFVLCLEPGRAVVEPPGQLLFLPGDTRVDPNGALPPAAIAAAEAIELREGNLTGAIDAYRRVLEAAGQNTPAASRPWALHGLARALAKANRPDEALRVYAELERETGARIRSLAADLIAQSEACQLQETLGRTADLHACARRFLANLVEPRWTLEPVRYGFYSTRVRAWLSKTSPNDAEVARLFADEDRKLALTAAAIVAADVASGLPAGSSGHRVLSDPGVLVFWRTAGPSRRIVIVGATLAALRKAVWPDVFSAVAADGFDVTLLAQGGAVVFETPFDSLRPTASSGHPEFPEGRSLRAGGSGQRTIQAGDTAWRLIVGPRDPRQFDRDAWRRLWLYVAMLALMLGSVVFAGVLGMRAVGEQVKVARLKSNFVSTVSHEFRSPLTGICHLADLLLRDRVPGEERRREYYEMILDEGRRLTRLVDHVLDFARMEEGRKQYRRDAIDTGPWLAAVVTEFERSSGARGKHVELSMAESLPRVTGDAEALAGAVQNLLDNAAKYSPDCDTINVLARADEGAVRIEVCDRGVGIPAEEQPRVFDRFFRGQQLADVVKGTGLGLSLVKHVVDAHGGSIALESAPGEGTRVTISLPTLS